MPHASEQYSLDLRYYGNAVGYQIALSLLISAPLFRNHETNVLTPLSALIGFCIELALKAFLANRLDDSRILNRLPARHDLQVLLDMSIEMGLVVCKDVEKLVKDLNDNHRNHFTRYMPAQGAFPQFDWLRVISATSKLCESVNVEINVAGWTTSA